MTLPLPPPATRVFAGEQTVYVVLAGSQEVRVRIPLGSLAGQTTLRAVAHRCFGTSKRGTGSASFRLARMFHKH